MRTHLSLRRAASRADRGFTLVELLVVIGIIALLIAILLPALNRAREQANLIKCLTNLRSMAQAAQLHANEHKGYMPIAGFQGPLTQGIRASSIGVGDPNRVRYLYFDDGDIGFRPLPLSMSLGTYMSITMPDCKYSWDVQRVLDSEVVQRPFTCPSQLDHRPGYSISEGGDSWTRGLKEYNSYILNEYVLGLSPAPQGGGMSAAGHLTQVRQPSEVFLFADGFSTDGALSGYAIQDVWTNDATLYEYWRIHVDDWGQFDHKRHRNRMNVVYVDGHAETVNLPDPRRYNVPDNRGDLDRIGLARGVEFR
jgi:prepilin-type N-terminal cleavage/methylation domain-containing protein/prepilin-type processing-associated H-X9-DG protein